MLLAEYFTHLLKKGFLLTKSSTGYKLKENDILPL